jgi:copper chaperone CopZ
MKNFSCFTALLVLAFSIEAADEKPAESLQTVTQRLLGVCCPEREVDLREAVKNIPGVELRSFDFEKGEITLAYDPVTLFPQQAVPKQGYKPEQIIERLDSLLRSNSGGSFTFKPFSTAAPKDKLTKVEIPILLLDCKGCRLGAYNSIAKIDGVERAIVSSKVGLVTALIDPAKTNRSALEEALKKARVELKAP